MAWLRQYQYNLYSPLQPGVVKALLLVLRSSAALALAAVAPLGVAQFIRMRTARSPRRGSQPVCIQTACRLQPHSVCVHSKRLRTAAVKKRRRQPHLLRISRKALRAAAFLRRKSHSTHTLSADYRAAMTSFFKADARACTGCTQPSSCPPKRQVRASENQRKKKRHQIYNLKCRFLITFDIFEKWYTRRDSTRAKL